MTTYCEKCGKIKAYTMATSNPNAVAGGGTLATFMPTSSFTVSVSACSASGNSGIVMFETCSCA